MFSQVLKLMFIRLLIEVWQKSPLFVLPLRRSETTAAVSRQRLLRRGLLAMPIIVLKLFISLLLQLAAEYYIGFLEVPYI